MCSLTVMSEEIAVDDVNQTIQLLFHQATQRNLQDELGEQLAVETGRGQRRGGKKVKVIRHPGPVDCLPILRNDPRQNLKRLDLFSATLARAGGVANSIEDGAQLPNFIKPGFFF